MVPARCADTIYGGSWPHGIATGGPLVARMEMPHVARRCLVAVGSRGPFGRAENLGAMAVAAARCRASRVRHVTVSWRGVARRLSHGPVAVRTRCRGDVGRGRDPARADRLGVGADVSANGLERTGRAGGACSSGMEGLPDVVGRVE